MDKKQNIIFIVLGLLLVVLIVVSVFISPKEGEATNKSEADIIYENAQRESAEAKSKELKEYTKIDTYKYLEYYEGSESKIVLVGTEQCQFCQIAAPILKSISHDYNLEINYLNISEFTEETESLFLTSNEFFLEGFGTPLLLVVKNGEIVDKIDGLMDKEHYIDLFKRNDFIKE